MTGANMRSDDCLRALARHHSKEVVVATYRAAFEWMAIKPEALTYLAVGAMGLASSHGLGLALGRPDKRVLVLDGDGSLLMNLSSLVTIGAAGPENLVHFVCENGQYAVNGGHPIPGAGRVDFAGLARAAGYRESLVIADLADFEARLPHLTTAPGPIFVTLKLELGPDVPLDYDALFDRERRRAFVAALAES